MRQSRRPNETKHTSSKEAKPRPVRRLFRRLMIVGALGVFALIAGVVFLGPSVAGMLAPGLVRGAAEGTLAGDLSLSDVHLTWFGPQRIGSLSIRDDAGATVLTAEVNASTSLIALARGNFELGEITLRGRVDLTQGYSFLTAQNADGSAPAPGAAHQWGATSGMVIPRSLAGKISFDGVTILYDGGGETNSSETERMEVVGDIKFAVGKPMTIALTGDSSDGAGRIKLNATIDNLTNAAGAIEPASASIEARLDASTTSEQVSRAAEALGLHVQEWLAEDFAAGPIELSIAYHGDASAGEASLSAHAPDSSAHACVRALVRDARVTLAEPATISAPITQAFVDRLLGPAAQGTFTLDEPVGVTLSIESLNFPAPSSGFDLRGASLRASMHTTQVAGAIRVNRDSDVPAASERRPFQIAPVSVSMVADDLAGPITLRSALRASYQGASAGELTLDLTANGMLDDRGALRKGLPPIVGDIAIAGASTELLQPFVDRLGLNLSETLGATLGATLRAQATGEVTGAADRAGDTEMSFVVDTTNLAAHGAMALRRERIITHADEIRVKLRSSAPTFDAVLRSLAPDSGVRIVGAGVTTLTIADLDLPIVDRTARPGLAHATVRLETGGFSGQFSDVAPMIAAESLVMSLALRPGADPVVRVHGALSEGGANFTAEGELTATDLFSSDGVVDVSRAAPTGAMRLRNVPTATLAALARLSPQDEALIARSVGASIDATIEGRRATAGDAFAVIFSAKGDGAQAQASLLATPGAQVEVTNARVDATLTPSLADEALRRFASDSVGAIRLASASRAALQLENFTIPLASDWRPDFSAVTPLRATLTIADDLLFTGIPAGGSETIAAGLRGVSARATIDPTTASTGAINLTSDFYDPRAPKWPVGALSIDGTLRDGHLTAQARIEQLDTQRLDALLGKPDLFALSLGATAAISAQTERPTPDDPWQFTLGVEAPKLNTTAIMRISVDHLQLVHPITAQWTMDERWGSKYLSASSSGGGASGIGIAGVTTMSVSIERLSIALGGAPMKPGVFELETRAAAPSLSLRSASGEITTYRDLAFHLTSVEQSGAIRFDATMSVPPPAAAPLRIAGIVAHLADEAGAITPERAEVTFQADGDAMTSLIDTIAAANGLLLEAVGPVITLQADADMLSRAGGALRADATSSKATATIAGRARDGVFLADDGAHLELSSIPPGLAERVFKKVFPMIGTLQKQPEDGPATFDARNLVLPIDGDLTRLSGELDLNLGRVRFQSSPFFAMALSTTSADPDALMLADWPPVKLTIDQGIVKYDRVQLPIAGGLFSTAGEVDLNRQEANIVVSIPLFNLSKDMAKFAESVPGITPETMIPMRMKGKLGSLKMEPAIDLLSKDLFKNPENVIQDILKRNLFRRKNR